MALSATTTGATVTIACKMPNGVHLDGEEPYETTEPVLGGGLRTTTMYRRTGKRVTLHGPAAPFGQAPKVRVVGGYALNENVDADFWNAWREKNKGSTLLTNRVIFALSTTEKVVDKATEQATVVSGLEPLDPNKISDLGTKSVSFGPA